MSGFFRYRKHGMLAARRNRIHLAADSYSFHTLIALFFVLLLLSACGRLSDNSSESGETGEELSGEEQGIAENASVTPAQAAMGDWVPFKVDDSPMNPLSPYVLPGLSDVGGLNPSVSLSPSTSEALIAPEELSLGVPADFPVNLAAVCQSSYSHSLGHLVRCRKLPHPTERRKVRCARWNLV